MSAYIVDKNHIIYLVMAAIRHHHGYTFSWWSEELQERKSLMQGDYQAAADAGNMLWKENIKSVSTRYPRESSGTLPGPVGGSFVINLEDMHGQLWDAFPPAQVLKACDCFEYQSCEHEGWHTSESKAFIDALRKSAWQRVPGYDSAQWGAPKTLNELRAEYRAAHKAA